MKRKYDIVHAILLVLFLVIANFIGNAIIKGILLLLFAGVLIGNAVCKLKMAEDSFRDKLFYGILLFLDAVLALGAIFAIVSGVMDLK
jgi:hypothetical protein